MKLWIAVDKDGSEFLYTEKPERTELDNFITSSPLCFEIFNDFFSKTILGRQLTFDDDPVELTISEYNSDLMSLIKRNYEATVARGLITPRTKLRDFIEKMKEAADMFGY